jgi:DNA-directed RNA polymerase specialized sigma24 family protein
MARFNSDFWEIPAGTQFLEGIAADRALWYETSEDRERRYAFQDFFKSVFPVVRDLIDNKLTGRQREVLNLYFFCGKTQEDIAAMLNLSQSTVSRHLFGTVRNGRKVGGAIPKLRKVVEKSAMAPIDEAMQQLQSRLTPAA